MASSTVLVDAVWPRRGVMRELALVTAGSLLVALCAQIRIPLPFTPVPITGQTFGVLLIGAALGATRGALSLALYLLEGAAGLPFFAGGAAGAGHLIGPTGGYLVGFVVAAWITGWLAERGWDRDVRKAIVAMTVGNLVIYLLGVLWLARFVGWEAAFVKGVLPFLPGDALKIGLAAAALPGTWRLLGSGR